MGSRTAAVRSVLGSPVLRRIQFGFLTFNIGEWATWLAMVVYAYGRGGATEAGVIAFVQLLPSVVVAPGAALLGDRYPRPRVLVGTYAFQAVAMGATVLALVGNEPLLVYLLGTVTATAITLTRPVQAALLPEVVTAPGELTAANVASGVTEGAGMLLGPILAGVLLGLAGPGLVFAVSGIGAALGAIAVWPVARRASMPVMPDATASAATTVIGELAAGLRAVSSDSRLRSIVVILAFLMGLVGALDIFFAILAIEVFDLGESGVGYLGAAVGLGALLGSGAAVLLVGRDRLSMPLLAVATLFGGSVALIAVAPGGAAAAGLLMIAGVGSAIARVAIATLTQRLAGDDVMSRVFGVEEAVMMAAQAGGALVVPLLLAGLGPEGALIAAGLAVPVATVVMIGPLVRADRTGERHDRQLRALRHVPMFMPLSAPVLECLASGSRLVDVDPGDVIIREGDPGDAFYVIESGAVSVDVGGVARGERRGFGESFGEIALLQDVPRTASVVAAEPCTLVVLDRDAFLSALTGQPRSRSLADRVAEERLRAPGAPAVDR